MAIQQDKDTSKYRLALQQSLDGIDGRVAWIEVCRLVVNDDAVHSPPHSARLAIFAAGSRVGKSNCLIVLIPSTINIVSHRPLTHSWSRNRDMFDRTPKQPGLSGSRARF